MESPTKLELPTDSQITQNMDLSSSDENFDSKDKSVDTIDLQENILLPRENLTAALQVLGAFFLMFNSWGVANTFGGFQTFYETNLLQDQTPSAISWIGSIQAFLLLIVGGFISGPIFDAGYMREMILAGTAISVFGMMMTSICREYWQVVLAQGIVVGTGMGFLLIPAVAVMPHYFTKRRAFATGIGAAGSSVGGVIYPTVFHELEPRIGFGWATRVIAFIMLGTLLIPIAVMRAKVFPATRRPLFDIKVLREIPYDLFCISTFFGMMGLYIPFYYLSTYSIEKDIVDQNLGFYLLTVINAASVFGRIVPNYFADKTGPLNIMAPFGLLCGIVAFCWTTLHYLWQVIIFCISYGFFSGTYVAIVGPCLAVLSPDLRLVGTHMGMSFGFSAFGLVIGTPVAGALLESYGWIGPVAFCGVCNILAGVFVLSARIVKNGPKLMVKA